MEMPCEEWRAAKAKIDLLALADKVLKRMEADA